jgi:uncharacterized protein (TIGR02001 family)
VPLLRVHTLSIVFAGLPLCAATAAEPQVGGSASIESDYRYRGIPLTDGKPALSLSISYDHDSGLYAGASAIGASGAHNSVRIGATEYLGYVARVSTRTAWDLGVTHSDFRVNSAERRSFDYTELYTGVIKDHVSAHVHYSPNYFGQGVSTVYVDLDGAFRPARQWRIFGHVGVLTPVNGSASPGSYRERYDLRAGVAAEFKGGELQLAWTTTRPDLAYPAGHTQNRDALVIAATCFF